MQKTTEKVAVHSSVPTIIEFLLDETGSMSRYLQQTINGFRDFIDEQRSQDGLCLLTLTKFDTNGQRNPYADLEIAMVPYLNANTFTPSASTNLNDAIVARIDARRDALTSWDIQPRVLFVCMTDGEDNASSYKAPYVKERVADAINAGWTFVFLGAYPTAGDAALHLGFPATNIRCFEGARMQETMQELAAATKAYRAALSTPTDFYASV